jgi:hypothetical protein
MKKLGKTVDLHSVVFSANTQVAIIKPFRKKL